MAEEAIVRIPPHHYTHVLDLSSNITRLELGPRTYIRPDNERVLFPPARMVRVPPRHYCVVENPVARDRDSNPVLDASGQAKLRHADREIRLCQEPFPLYPGEELQLAVSPLRVVPVDSALRLRALIDHEDDSGERRLAGDEWLFQGPATYIPHKEVEVVESLRATIVLPNHAVKLRARRDLVDRASNTRVTGEEWLWRKLGAYLPGAYEEVVEIVSAHILTDKKALHVRATRSFTSAEAGAGPSGPARRCGEEWLVSCAQTDSFIPGVHEEVVSEVDITTLTRRQYCVLVNPVGRDGKPQLGHKLLVKGEKSFFLQPGEWLENGIQEVYILGEEEGLVLTAREAFTLTDESGDVVEERRAGDRWMIRGPLEYVPPVQVEVVARRHSIPMDDNEGIYVRDIKSGKVRAVCGQTYMLTQDEELWEKSLPPNVESLLTWSRDPLSQRGERPRGGVGGAQRDRTRVVTYSVPHNAAVQVYDYKEKRARVVFGPEMVRLDPDEHFTVLSLSGDKPKRPHVTRSLCLLLGPDFCSDVITVETADHARLQLQLSYNWWGGVVVASLRLFSVPDFVGDACKAVASRVRGSVASVQFDDFHKNSSKIIRTSVFGLDESLRVRPQLRFPQNGLIISSVDVQGVEPVDQRTRDALQKSVQLAIEITTNSQEATARHEAERLEQEARGRLERQRISDQAEAEKARKELLQLQAYSAAVESTGEAKAEAMSRAESARIEGEASVEQAKLRAEAAIIDAASELDRLRKAREAELEFTRVRDELEIARARALAAIEVQKFQDSVQALGTETIRAIATAGPDAQVKLLQSLGLQSTLITDGSNPINLFTTAAGLIGGLPAIAHQQSQ
uniref:Major vault protein n=1 Tax=Petromyzon marinus TaxID=7757 RepID=A0AAJ7WJM1_PETMA|nr:major vault protein [Petromyzon marinus]